MMQRHFNVTTYVMDPKNKEFLMVLHKKLSKWVPPGGHIEENEKPDDAALREIKEETGIEATLIGSRFPREEDLMRPYGIQLNVIEPEKHEHMDLVYLAFPKPNQIEQLNIQETSKIGWFTLDEIEDPSFDGFPETKEWCRFFFEMF